MTRLPVRLQFPSALTRHRQLFWRLSEREVSGRYRGSVLGWSWSFLQPLLMLAVYSFVFSEVFQSRWGNDPSGERGPLAFAINLFAGLIVFNLFSECASKAPTLILHHSNYVTKVVFPVELLPAVTVASASFHALTSLAVLGVFQLISNGSIPPSMLWLPLVWLPLLMGSLGVSWCLSALGVFLRDIDQLVSVSLSMLMFLSAVFYPLAALPPAWQPLLGLNPLVRVIEETRRVCVMNLAPHSSYLLLGTGLSLIFCEISFRAFQRARRGFADVL